MVADRIDLRGTDDLSSFRVSRGRCGVCGRRGLVVRYDRHRVTGLIDDARRDLAVYRTMSWRDILENPSSIIRKCYPTAGRKRGEGALGVQCGCYARAHRQLAHIADSVESRMRNGGLIPSAHRADREAGV